MNTVPFSLHTKFLPQHAQEDKIDLEIGGWEVLGLGTDVLSERRFKQSMASPPAGCEEMAWKVLGKPLMHGWFFLRPAMIGKDRDKLVIRRQGFKHPAKGLRHEAPLCGGHCLFYRDKKAGLVGGSTLHRAKLRLSLNLQRFIRHQPYEDDPSQPRPLNGPLWIKERTPKRSFHGEEFCLDGEDNWLPNSTPWRQFRGTIGFRDYLNAIVKVVDGDIKRACNLASVDGKCSADDWEGVVGGLASEHYSLSKVETLWEFRSNDPIGDVYKIGAKLMHLKKEGGKATHYASENKQSGRNQNTPCFTVPIAEDVELKLYAKTNHRIRFEVVHRGLMSQRSELLEEAGIAFEKDSRTFDEIPSILGALRIRAAKHLNQVMAELREGRDGEVKACSAVELLAEVSAAVPPSLPAEHYKRLGQVRLLLYFLCYQNGFRGNVKEGPMAATLTTLKKRGVIYYDRPRQCYVLSPAYVSAVDSLVGSTGDPLLSFYTTDETVCPRSLVRFRE